MKAPNDSERTAASLEDNLKKALTEFLILFLLCDREYYIGELTTAIFQRSKGLLSVVFPYSAIYRLCNAGYVAETRKRIAPDGRLRQYYRITSPGRVYVKDLLETYQRFTGAVSDIIESGGNAHDESAHGI